MMRRKLTHIFFYIILFFNFGFAYGIETKIIAMVNNEPITTYELKNKIITKLVLSNQNINQETIDKSKNAAMNSLINIKLKKNEIKKHKIETSQTNINSYLNRVASNDIELFKQKFINNSIDYQIFLNEIKIEFRYTSEGQQTFLNGEEISKAIREADVTARVSQVAKIPEVRAFLVAQQQDMGVKKGIVMDGRDIGTVVFPEAECKFFLTARPEVRAKRRHIEQLEQGNKQTFESVLENLKERDYLDSNRTASPLVKAEDAIEIDVSEASLDEVYEVLWSHISEKIAL